MEQNDYHKLNSWLYAECTDTLRILLNTFTKDRLSRISESITWSENINNNEIQYELTVFTSCNTLEKVILSATLSKIGSEYITLHPLKAVVSDEDV